MQEKKLLNIVCCYIYYLQIVVWNNNCNVSDTSMEENMRETMRFYTHTHTTKTTSCTSNYKLTIRGEIMHKKRMQLRVLCSQRIHNKYDLISNFSYILWFDEQILHTRTTQATFTWFMLIKIPTFGSFEKRSGLNSIPCPLSWSRVQEKWA